MVQDISLRIYNAQLLMNDYIIIMNGGKIDVGTVNCDRACMHLVQPYNNIQCQSSHCDHDLLLHCSFHCSNLLSMLCKILPFRIEGKY